MKVLITGGTGGLGKLVSQTVSDAGYSVRILSRRARPGSHAANVDWTVGDLVSGKGLEVACAGVEIIMHCATDPRRSKAVDVEGTKHLLQALRPSSVAHLVYISIVGIDRIPFSYYQAKLQAEKMIENSGLRYSILRATQFHSLLDGFISFAARLPLILPLPTDFQFQPVYEMEVANLMTRIVAEPPTGRVPDFAGPKVMRLKEIAATWIEEKQLRKRLVHIRIPGRVADAFREGRNTAPEAARGVVTWRESLRSNS